MDDRLYDTSLTLYAVTDISPPYDNLLQAHQRALETRASSLREYLNSRPLYEHEEEKEKIGTLRDCTWTPFTSLQSRRTEADAIAITLTYDRATYRFILHSNFSKTPKLTLPLLLAKASASLSKRFLSFLEETFQVTTTSLRLPASFLATTISAYTSTLHSSFTAASATSNTSTLALLKDTLGTLKLTIAINSAFPNGAEISQHLRTMDIDIPPETLHQLLTSPPPQQSGIAHRSKQSDFLPVLQRHVHQRTGLVLPLLPQDSQFPDDETTEPPLKLSRISNLSFALSTEGRLKFSSRAFEALEAYPDLEQGEGNVVKRANVLLLESIVGEAMGDP